ncbi:MAG TPA: ribosome maturation factor RimM [Candidatus Marinimicrobia bacterium]|jgi:16S rRNA processing protein RimM|nr:ribosome maturation factor RimM [Candidatus Neomarinimicrobiota bacterium]HJM69373.1 ribosome maturation factor RimM [Candidatus Neomarinimicrobiota bacterium]|tara:strand:- start:2352 stop:2870 length:519 start_codon:yes stop_codon:yes gene_type:complete
MSLTDMSKKKVHPIATISRVSGRHGEVRLQPLSRYFDEYIETRDLRIGFDMDMVREIKLSKAIGQGKKRRFKFEGILSRDEAETLIGQTLYAEGREGDNAELISKDLLGYSVITESGELVGNLADILWLPSNDVYVIQDGENEKLIPVIKEIIIGVDHLLRVIMIAPMEGLL